MSLFSGAGGLDLGFHDAGFEIVQMVELDPGCATTLRANAGAGGLLHGAEVRCQDIRKYEPSAAGPVEFIVGGPPCQSFSAAGRRAAGVAGINDDRGTLFEEYVRILRAVRPVGFLFENVYGITGANGGRAWEAVQAGFAAAGYRAYWRVLDAADYGVPQHRERMIVVGVRAGEFRFPRPTHGPDSAAGRPHYTAGDAVAGAAADQSEGVNGRYGHLLAAVPPGLNYSFFTERMNHPQPLFAWRSKFSDFLYKADPTAPVRTLKAQGGQYTGPFHWDGRRFSVAELKRLQTIPDAYRLPDARQRAVKMVGNSVPPQMARVLALAVREQVFGDSPVGQLDTLAPADPLGFRTRKRERTDLYKRAADAALGDRPALRAPTRLSERCDTHRARLTPRFALVRDDSGPLQVESVLTANEWCVGVVPIGRQATHAVHIVPATGQTWTIPAPVVRLVFAATTYTAVWKAFETTLADHGGKADLVQLNNYYQYPSRLAIRVARWPAGGSRWRALAAVAEGGDDRAGRRLGGGVGGRPRRHSHDHPVATAAWVRSAECQH